MFGLRWILLGLIICVFQGCAVMHAADRLGVSGGVRAQGNNAALSVYFSSEDRQHILGYYKDAGKKRKKAPPGLAKKDKLPPGLEKQVVKNGQLPPGLQGRGLPSDLEKRLSPLPAGYVRLEVGRSIVLMNQKTGIVVDLVADVVL